MGVQYDVIVCYGIAFEWWELESSEELQRKAKESGHDDLMEAWYELGFTSVSPYYDAPYSERLYVIGIRPQMKKEFYGYNASDFKEFVTNAESKDNEIEELCEKYDLPYVKPRLLILQHVC